MALKTCRCCCSQMPLGKAAKIIGVVFAVMGFISLIVEAVNLSKMDSAHDWAETNLHRLTGVDDNTGSQLLENLRHARKMLVLRLCSVILFFIFSLILVAGAYKANKCLVLTFTVYFVIYMILMTIATFYAFYDPYIFIDESSLGDANNRDPQMIKIIVYVSLAITLAIVAFFWYLAAVIYSYYKELARGNAVNEHTRGFKF